MKVSVCASSIRPHLWYKMYESLKTNRVDWEMIMVGPNEGESPGKRFTHIKTNVKPAQCYEIAFRAAKGETLTWTADDCTYSPCALDIAYKVWSEFKDVKTVVAFRTVEDGKDITEVHHLIGKQSASPRMAPFGLMSTQLLQDLKGYDNRFVCGQSENDVVMRVLEIGGRVEICDAEAIVNHQGAHESTVFRQGYYFDDRAALECNWLDGRIVVNRRLTPVQPFVDDGILEITQGVKGKW